MASVDLIGPRGETATVTDLGRLQHLVGARGYTVTSGSYTDAVALLSGYANHPGAPTGAEAVPSRPTGAVAPYNAQTRVANRTGDCLRFFEAALARSRSGGGAAKVLYVGDSITGGFYTTVPYNVNSWVDQARVILNGGKFGPTAEGAVWFANGFATANESRFTLTANSGSTPFNQVKGFGWGGNVAGGRNTGSMLSLINTGSLAWATTTSTDTFTVYYGGGGDGPLVSIDSVAQTQAPTQPGSASSVFSQTYTTTAGVHTFTVSAAATKTVFLFGVEAYTAAAAGLRISRGGVSGAVAVDFAQTASLNMIDVHKPDLVVISLGVNDQLQNLDPATSYAASLSTVIDRVRTNKGDAVLVTPTPANQDGTATFPLSQYIAQMYATSVAKNVPLIDMNDAWPVYGTANTAPFNYGWTSAVHPNFKGHSFMAQIHATALASLV